MKVKTIHWNNGEVEKFFCNGFPGCKCQKACPDGKCSEGRISCEGPYQRLPDSQNGERQKELH